MLSKRFIGYEGSRRTQAPPVLRTATIASIDFRSVPIRYRIGCSTPMLFLNSVALKDVELDFAGTQIQITKDERLIVIRSTDWTEADLSCIFGYAGLQIADI